MNWLLWLAVGVGLATLLWLLSRAARPIIYRAQRQADMPAFMHQLTRTFGIGGGLEIAHEATPFTIHLVKEMIADSERGVRLELRDGLVTAEQVQSAAAALQARGFLIDLRAHPTLQGATRLSAPGLRPAEALRAIEVVREAVGLEPDATFRIHYFGPASLSETMYSLRRWDL